MTNRAGRMMVVATTTVMMAIALVTVGCSRGQQAATAEPGASDAASSTSESSPAMAADSLASDTEVVSESAVSEPEVAEPAVAEPLEPIADTGAVADASPVASDVSPDVADAPPVDKVLEPSLQPLARIAARSPSTLTTLTSTSLPEVKMSVGHAALSAVQTDDAMPSIALPDLEGNEQELSALYGDYLTVVFFWKGDRALARAELADLGPDVVMRFEGRGVNVVGIAVEETAETAEKHISDAGATYPNLLDEDGRALELMGTAKLPRTYLLNSEGEVLWYDIEYSRATRRGLRAAIQAALRQIPRAG